MSGTNSASESPLKNTLYRFLWIAMFAGDIGTAMQTVGSGWLITSLAISPFVVSLLQVMTSLSIFLLALPAGALADIVDRRKLFLATQYFALAVAAILSLLTFGGFTTPNPSLRYTVGDDAALLAQKRKELPDSEFQKLVLEFLK